MSKGQVEIITQYISDHPGCTMGDVIRGSGQNKSSVASTLCRLTASKAFRRDGSDKFYRYYLEDANVRRHNSKASKSITVPNAANPLNSLFNQCLASVRGGRAAA